MAPVQNKSIVLKEWPGHGYPVPGKTLGVDTETMDLDTVPLNGGYLLKMLVFSIDPFMRRRLNPNVADFVIHSFHIGKPVDNFGVGVVLRSEHSQYKVGDHVVGLFQFQEYVVSHHSPWATVVENKEQYPWQWYIGILGLAGQTAYFAWEEYAKPKKGDIVFVTAASGAVGAVAVQIAKAAGLKVIASAGSDEKVAYVKSLGADVVFNYKTTSTREVLEKEGPIDIFFDNVGGEVLEAALDNAALQARFIISGSISNYNTGNPHGVKNLQLLIWREIHLYGFIKTRLDAKYTEQFFREFAPLVASGKIKNKEWAVHGLENAGQALVDVLQGKNFGKCVVVVADE